MKCHKNFSVLKLGRWEPSHFDRLTIHREFVEFVRNRKIAEDPYDVSVFGPGRHQIFGPHRDCYGEELYMLMWSNVHPTRIWLNDGREVKIEPGEVVLIDNRAVMHDCPKEGLTCPHRWFARIRVNKNQLIKEAA